MRAFAKVNLMLHVTGRRGDGYHCLQSLVMFASLGDHLTWQPEGPLGLTTRGPFAEKLESPADNLVLKAAHAFAQSTNRAAHGTFTLDKQLPVGAGLGGGSSDAAAALRLLSEAWACPIPDGLAAQIGSDVPACLHAAPLWMEGVGEAISPQVILPDVAAVLVNPGIPLATPRVFQALSTPYDAPITAPGTLGSLDALLAFLRGTHNALEMPATELEPVIRSVLAALSALPGCALARMSGSGASCFALFPSTAEARAAASSLRAAHPAWWVEATTLKGNPHG